jgi:uncharacterized protein YndB with AHSA1/START domain
MAADADAVFALVSDPERLSSWNTAIRQTTEAPDDFGPGAQWVVELSALGQTWPSRSTVTDLDRTARRFAYRSQTDDGNLSYADWTWSVTEAPGGCDVAVSVALHPATFWRRALLARIRGFQLRRRELPGSLEQLEHAVRGAGASGAEARR